MLDHFSRGIRQQLQCPWTILFLHQSYGLLPKEQQCLVEEKRAPPNNAIPQRLAAALDSANLLNEEWLEHVLCGRKTWEIRSARTHKRERVSLAQSGTELLIGDVEIGIFDCIEIYVVDLRANIAKHCVPLELLPPLPQLAVASQSLSDQPQQIKLQLLPVRPPPMM